MLKQLGSRKPFIFAKLAILLVINLALILPQREVAGFAYLVGLLLVASVLIFIAIARASNATQSRKFGGAYTIFLVFLMAWMLLVVYLQWGDPVLYPSPMRVLELFVLNFSNFLENLEYSFKLFGVSFLISSVLAFPAGLVLGSCAHARQAWDPYIKILSLISPIAYTPYIVGIMPTFYAAQVFVVATGIFWPILKWTVYGVTNLDKNYTLTAQLMGMSKFTYYTRVVIPGIMPAVLTGIGASISGGFTVLVAAELLGSHYGLGFFIKYFADFMNYHNVVVGIIYLGIAVCFITWLYEKIQSAVLSWQVNERKRSHAILRKIRSSK